MPEAYCSNCDSPASPMIVSGWGLCRSCRDLPERDYRAIKEHVESMSTQKWLRQYMERYLAQERR